MTRSVKITGSQLADVLNGSGLSEKLRGKGGADVINGASGNDRINGSNGNDIITGGAGDDTINGNYGIDTAVYSGLFSQYALAFGHDADLKGTVTDLVANRDGTDSLRKVEFLQFQDAVYDVQNDVVFVLNHAPVLANAIPGVSRPEDNAVLFTLAANTFTDADGDPLTYSATLDGGGALPAWLTFDAATRTFSGTPPLDFNGFFDIRVSASDGMDSASTVFQLAITPANDAPVAADDSASGDEDSPITTGNVLANDTDVDSTLTAASISIFTQAGHGGVVKNADGTFTYTPQANFNGSDSFTYTISDGALSANATVTVNVAAVNDVPTITGGDTPVAYEDGPRTPSGRFTGSDADANSVLTWSVDNTAGTYGTLTFNNGAWSYSLANSAAHVQALAQGERVLDKFTVRLTDEHGATATQELAVAVIGTDDAPAAIAPAFVPGVTDGAVTAGSLVATGHLTASDTDHGAALTWSVSGSASGYSSNYRYALDDLSIVKNGAAYFHDGFLNSAPVGPVPLAPAFADGTAASYQGPGRYSVQGGNLVLDGAFAGASNGVGIARLIAGQPLQLNSDINPNDLSRGLKSTDNFTVEASYSFGSNTSGPNDIWQSVGVTLNDRTVGGVLPNQLGNDLATVRAVRDASGGISLQFSQLNAVADTATVLQTIPLAGLTQNPDHAIFRLTHDAASPGVVHASVDLLAGGSTFASFSFNEVAHIFTDENWTRVQLAAFGADIGGSSITTRFGSATVDPGGQWTYTLDPTSAAFNALNRGQVVNDTFAVRVTDEYGLSVLRTVSVAVTGLGSNHNPVALNDSFTTDVFGPVRMPIATLLQNDSDADGDVLRIVSAGPALTGTVALLDDAVVFTPNPGTSGSDSFSYTITDGRGGSSTALITVTYTPPPPPNHIPVANDDWLATPQDRPLAIPFSALTANDTDADGDPLSVSFGTQPRHGRVEWQGDRFLYMPASEYVGSDSFQYSVTDGHGDIVSGTVQMTVVGGQIDERAVDVMRFVSGPQTEGANTGMDLDLLNTGTLGGIYAPVTGNLSGTFTPIPSGAPAETQVVMIAGEDGASGFYRMLFTLPPNVISASVQGAANVDDIGRAFINLHPISDPLFTGRELSEYANVHFSSSDATAFASGLNALLISDANTGLGPSGTAFYAYVGYETSVHNVDWKIPVSMLGYLPLGDAVTVDWGDRSEQTHLVNGDVLRFQHLYPQGFVGTLNIAGGVAPGLGYHVQVAPDQTVEKINAPAGPVSGGYVWPSISADGQIVTFAWGNPDPSLPGAGAVPEKLYSYDRTTGALQDITPQLQAYLASVVGRTEDYSSDGQFHAYTTFDGPFGSRVFVEGGSQGGQFVGDGSNPSISNDGRYVAYDHVGPMLTGGGPNVLNEWSGWHDVYLYDRVAQTTSLIDHYPDPFPGGSNPSISGDGRFIAYVETWHDDDPTTDIVIVDHRPPETVLTGTPAADFLVGNAGNNVLIGDAGADVLIGNAGADRFVYRSLTDAGDMIADFSLSQADKLDIRDLLVGYDAQTSILSDFVRVASAPAGAVIQVDPNGAIGGSVFTDVVTLQGLTALGLSDLVQSGALSL